MSLFEIGDDFPPSVGREVAGRRDVATATWQLATANCEIKAESELVEGIRRALQENGYKPVLVCTGKKKPAHEGWQKGSPNAELYPSRLHALNTGILTGDVLALDIDCDDPDAASRIGTAARKHFGSAPCRGRSNSARRLSIYRAASAGMRKVKLGPSGVGIELLATGQQFVAYGLHESGVPYNWENDIGPHNIRLSDLPPVTQTQVDAFLAEANSILRDDLERPRGDTKARAFTESPPQSWGNRPTIFDGRPNLPDLNANAQAGLEVRTWFDELSPADKNAFLHETAEHPAMVALADQNRDIWLPLLFALADAERRGATEAKEIARKWSQTSQRYNEKNFERDWGSFR